jgi:hypothetical protein
MAYAVTTLLVVAKKWRRRHDLAVSPSERSFFIDFYAGRNTIRTWKGVKRYGCINA